jgi:hypothetical protein
MSERRQSLLFFLLSVALSAFLMGHSLLVQVDFEACFGNVVESLRGNRPYRQVVEMSFGQLAYSAGQAISVNHLIIALFGLLPLSPFWIARMVSQGRLFRQLCFVSAIVAFIVIVGWYLTNDLREFYDCDRNGVSLGILVAPILYTAVTSATTLALVFLRSLFLSATGRE